MRPWNTASMCRLRSPIAKEGPKFGFTKADMSGKVASYFDLSYLSEATGKPIDQLDTLRK